MEIDEKLSATLASDDPDEAVCDLIETLDGCCDEVAEKGLRAAAGLGLIPAMVGYADFLEQRGRDEEAVSERNAPDAARL